VTTYKLEELATAAGVGARTVRYYVQRGLLPAPDFRGSHTTYGREHLLRLRAIRRLQESHLPLDVIQARLATLSWVELESLARGVPSSNPPEHPPERPPEILPPAGSPYRAPAPPPRDAAAPSRPLVAVWHRLELAPGLELSVRTDAPADSLHLARALVGAHQPSLLALLPKVTLP
jgi:DNA-binding transcriptional MerR regulator